MFACFPALSFSSHDSRRRFPVISGFRVSWDSRRPPGQRVLGVWLLQEQSSGSTSNSGASTPMTPTQSGYASPQRAGSAASSTSNLLPNTPASQSTPALVDGEPIHRIKGGRMYKIVTREYMAQGHDGFLPLKGNKYLVDDESGQLMSAIVRKYLLGASLVKLKIRDAHPDVTPWALRRLPLCESPLSPGEYARCEAPRP